MTDWLRDARVGLRSLLQKPGFTLVAVLTLAVGLGANTAIYSFVQAVMLHPLPFPEPERLVQIWETAERDELELRSLSFPVLEDIASSFLGLFGGVALLLAAGGLYGLLAHLVAQRSREIGIQMALGASAARISRRIVGQGLVLAGAGIFVGLVTSVAFGRLVESRLFEVSGTDPWTLVSCALLLIAVAMVASYLPARRATRLDPVLALRQQ